MRHLHEKTGFVLRLILLSLLLAAQTLALAHEFDHLGHPGQTECAACSIGGSLSGPVHVEHENWEPAPALPVDTSPVPGLWIQRSITHPPSRAPPHLS